MYTAGFRTTSNAQARLEIGEHHHSDDEIEPRPHTPQTVDSREISDVSAELSYTDSLPADDSLVKNREIAVKQRVPDEKRVCRKCWMLSPVSLCNGLRPFCRTPICHHCVDIGSQRRIECAPCQKEKSLLMQPIVAALSEYADHNAIGVILLYIDVRHYECVDCSSALITIVNDDFKRAIDSEGDPCGYTVDGNDTNIRVFCPKCAHKQNESYEIARWKHGEYAVNTRKYAQIVRCAWRYTNYAVFEKKQKQKRKPNRPHNKKKKNVQHLKDKETTRRQREAAEAKNKAKTLETAAMMRRWAERKREGKPRRKPGMWKRLRSDKEKEALKKDQII